MEITFIRHGIVQANIENRVMDQAASEPLTEQGLEDVKTLAIHLKEQGTTFDIIFASPARRTMQTAEVLAATFGLEIIQRSQLVERSAGTLTGKTWTEVEQETRGAMSLSVLHATFEIDYTPYGGESPAEVRARLREVLNEIKSQYPDKKVLVVSHGGIIKTMYALYTNEQPFEPGNISVHRFTV